MTTLDENAANALPGAREQPAGVPDGERRRPISMHEHVAPWADHCSCGAEPYWLAVAEELGIDLTLDSQQEDGKP